MKTLYVLYDAKCELCRRVRVWLQGQAPFVPLAFVPLQSADLEDRFPGVAALEPERQILVVADSGEVWRGADAWIMSLWALREYREWSQRLASPLLRPFAMRVCDMVSRNRHRFSQWFQRTGAQEIASELAAQEGTQASLACDAGCGTSENMRATLEKFRGSRDARTMHTTSPQQKV
jgi:predicted DCC family thiol-disulfide oxidoreductase YuxK